MDELGNPLTGAAPRGPAPQLEADVARRATLPLLAGYLAFGQYWGVWVILVFDFQRFHELTDSRLGGLYMMLSIAAVVVMLVLAPRLQRLPLSVTVPLSMTVLAAGSIVIAYQPSTFVVIGFLLVGAGNGLIDVYLNVAAQRVEVATRRPVLQWLHASYALGGVTGAAIAGSVLVAGMDFRWGLVVAGLSLVVTAAWTSRTTPAERSPEGVQTAFSVSALFRTPALWVPALTVLFAFLVEGSMDTWSGLYLREQLDASAGVAAMAFIAFSGAIFLGRMFAGRVLFGLGARTTIIVAGLGSLAGGLLATLTDNLAVVGVAYLILGFMISAAAPAGFSLTEDIDEDPSSAIAAVTTVGYTGFIWSPPLLGYVAQTIDLRAAMTVIVIATVGIVVAGLTAPRSRMAPSP
ncbi:MAG: MFS transporter [Actinomycetota bacterium]|nr:MFS transporter [Actinomycetota bacterium]MDH5223285.1 MFS transporter [Actinomycetota bacterium]MDH5313983.1 MFS transporter [Actinomycetota bacterium]